MPLSEFNIVKAIWGAALAPTLFFLNSGVKDRRFLVIRHLAYSGEITA